MFPIDLDTIQTMVNNNRQPSYTISNDGTSKITFTPYNVTTNTAAALGIVNGDGENFRPTAVITRQEMAVIIHRVFELLEAEVSGEAISFDDGEEIAEYAKEAVETLTGAGILNGMGDGSFAPRGTVTRAQSAKVVYELLNLLGGGK